MIAQLTGTCIAVGGTWAVIDLSGFGIKVLCAPATASGLRVGQQTTLATSLVVREDALTLYAFANADERDTFERVQSVTGVGPRIAQAVVSVLNPEELRAAIASGNVAALTRVPGIGAKGAQRMILELKDKIGLPGAVGLAAPQNEQLAWRAQVKSGLEGLGWSARDAESACDRVAAMVAQDPTTPVAALMRAALQSLAR